MSENIKNMPDADLISEKTQVFAAMKSLQAEADKRSDGVFTAEEEKTWDETNKRYDDLAAELESRESKRAAGEKAEERRQKLADEESRRAASEGRRTAHDKVEVVEQRDNYQIEEDVMRRFLDSDGPVALNAAEKRALQSENDILGGTFVAGTQFVNRLVKFMDDMVFLRSRATVLQVDGAHSIEVPSWDTDPDDADNTSELGTGSEDSAARTGKRHLTPRPIAKRLLVSRTLVRHSATPILDFVASRLAYKFGITAEKDFLSGSGASESLGVFTASDNGVSTDRDVSSGNTTTGIKGDGLINALYSLKAQYQMSPNTAWLFHRDAMAQIRKLKTGDGDYLWVRGLGSEPDTILGKPVMMSEYVPNTFTTGLYVGAIADWSHYWIAESLGYELQTLNELYAATNQIGLIARAECDGMPVLEEAFARVTLA